MKINELAFMLIKSNSRPGYYFENSEYIYSYMPHISKDITKLYKLRNDSHRFLAVNTKE